MSIDHDAKKPVTDFAVDWDHTDPQWVSDPYPIWEDLREPLPPVAHTDRYGGGWFPATHAGVSAIAKDTDNFTSRTVVIGNGRPAEDALPAADRRGAAHYLGPALPPDRAQVDPARLRAGPD